MIIIIVAVVRFHQETFKVTKYPHLRLTLIKDDKNGNLFQYILKQYQFLHNFLKVSGGIFLKKILNKKNWEKLYVVVEFQYIFAPNFEALLELDNINRPLVPNK